MSDEPFDFTPEDEHWRTRSDGYRPMNCTNCNRVRVLFNGVCEKCEWDVDRGNYASITRPTKDESTWLPLLPNADPPASRS